MGSKPLTPAVHVGLERKADERVQEDDRQRSTLLAEQQAEQAATIIDRKLDRFEGRTSSAEQFRENAQDMGLHQGRGKGD